MGRQSQGIQGRVSQGGLSLRASEGRFSNQNQKIILQDSLDKQDSIADETAKCSPLKGGVQVYSQDTFGNDEQPQIPQQ